MCKKYQQHVELLFNTGMILICICIEAEFNQNKNEQIFVWSKSIKDCKVKIETKHFILMGIFVIFFLIKK